MKGFHLLSGAMFPGTVLAQSILTLKPQISSRWNWFVSPKSEFYVNELPYRKKLRRRKFSSDKIFRRYKFSSPRRNFVTFIRRRIFTDQAFFPFSNFHVFEYYKIFPKNIFVGENFRHFLEISSLLSNEVFSDKVCISDVLLVVGYQPITFKIT